MNHDGNGNTVAVVNSISGPIVTATWDYSPMRRKRPHRAGLEPAFAGLPMVGLGSFLAQR